MVKDKAIIKKEIKVLSKTRKNREVFVVFKFSKIISSGSGAGVTSTILLMSLIFFNSFYLSLQHLQIIEKIFLKK